MARYIGDCERTDFYRLTPTHRMRIDGRQYRVADALPLLQRLRDADERNPQ